MYFLMYEFAPLNILDMSQKIIYTYIGKSRVVSDTLGFCKTEPTRMQIL